MSFTFELQFERSVAACVCRKSALQEQQHPQQRTILVNRRRTAAHTSLPPHNQMPLQLGGRAARAQDAD